MTDRRALLLGLFVFASALIAQPAAAQVRGHVMEAQSGEPVRGVLVWLTGRTLHMAHSGSDGAYEFTDVPAGSYCIRVDSPGYEAGTVCLSVTATARMIVDLPLTTRPVIMEPLLVRSRRGADAERRGREGDSVQAVMLEASMLVPRTRTSALAAAQLGDLAQMPAYDQTGGRRPHALYVWGSSAERGRVLLDGASLSAPLHLGALLPPLDPDVIAATEVHSGGISPRYDGGTTYIMDFTTRAASNERRVWGELDLLAGRIGAETPINGRGRAIMSVRRVNDEIIDGLVSSRFGYGYADALARVDFDLSEHSGIHLTGLTTREGVSIQRDLADDRASWTNRAATLVWQHDDAGDLKSATLSMSRGVADLPLLSAPGGHLAATLDRFDAVVQRRWDAETLHWDAGAEIEHLAFRRRASATADPATGEEGRFECTTLLPCSHARATLVSGFAELSLAPRQRMTASLGVRTMYDTDAQRVHVLPRASITFLPSDGWAVTIAGGRFSQAYVREVPPAEDAERVDLPIDVAVAHATHLELGIARYTERLRVRAGAYVRHHAGVSPTELARNVPGADIAVDIGTGLGTLSLAYSISDSRYRSEGRRASMIQQLATAAIQGRHGRWQFDASAAYGSGLPLTSIVLEQPEEGFTMSQPTSPLQPGNAGDAPPSNRDYLRVDGMIGAEWRVGGDDGGVRIMPYVRIINALSRRESLFYFQDGDDPSQPPRGLAELPAVPMIGLRWNF